MYSLGHFIVSSLVIDYGDCRSLLKVQTLTFCADKCAFAQIQMDRVTPILPWIKAEGGQLAELLVNVLVIY